MDVLTAVARELRFESVAYRWLDLGSPFRITFDQPWLRGVHIISSGQCELVLADGTVRLLTAGDVVVLPRGDSHVLRSVGAGDGPMQSGFELAARTDGARLGAGGLGDKVVVVCGAFVVHEASHPVLRGLPRLVHVPGGAETESWLAPLVESIRNEVFDPRPGGDVVMARLSDALVVQALRFQIDAVDEPSWLGGLADPQVAAALQAIHENPSQPWTLVSLAKHCGLSRSAFSARFAARVGQPAMAYLASIRMQHARTILRDERATIATVAARVGYTSEVAFAAAFKREVGSSPGAYRRQHAG